MFSKGLKKIGFDVKSCLQNVQGKSLFSLIESKSELERDVFVETGGLYGPWPSPKKHNVFCIRSENKKLIERGEYGERGGSIKSEWNPIDSTILIRSSSTRNYKKLDLVEHYEYNDSGELIERIVLRYRKNQVDYLELRDRFNYNTDSMKCISYKRDGEIRSLSNQKMSLPLVLEDEIYDQKVLDLNSRILLTEKHEFIYDKEKRLVKIIHKNKYDNLLGYTKYKYRKLKKTR